MKHKLKALGIVLGMTIVMLGVGVAVMLCVMAKQDAEHAAFYNTGASIKAFVGDYGKAVKAAFKAKDMSGIAIFFADDYPAKPRGDVDRHVLQRGQWSWEAIDRGHDVSAWKLTSAEPWLTNKAETVDDLSKYFQGMRSVEEIRSKIDMIERIDSDRSVVLRVKFILDGTTHHGQYFQDRHFYRWHVAKTGADAAESAWQIMSDELVEGVRVAGDGRRFVELDLASSGIDYRHARNPMLNKEQFGDRLKFDVVEHSAGGAAVMDYNNDGWPDIFFADGQDSRLYRNNGTPEGAVEQRVTFTDVTRAAGLDGIDQAQAGFFADVDNDGFQDLFVTRYLAPNKFYRNNGNGTFNDRSSAFGLDFAAPSTSATFFDYDRDGFVDLYVGVFGDAFATIPRLPFFAQNGEPNRLFHNEGGKRFTEVTKVSGVGDTGWSLAVAAGDYDNDGYPDLAVANDFGRKNLYHNNQDGTFTEVAKQAGVLDFSGGMGVAFGDFNEDGYLDLYTSNINSNQRWFGEDMTIRQFLRNVLRTKWAFLDLGEFIKSYRLLGAEWTEVGKMVGEGNSLFQNNQDGTFTEVKDSNANRAGWGWSVVFFDMDNDTDLDIYAANGWISNQPGSDL